MLVKPTVTDLLKKVDNRYSLIIMTAKRARQIANGDDVLTQSDDKSPVSLAVDEIFDGKVYEVNNKENEE
jgi:DNA-directed RNA polymerase subunit omega